MLFCVKVACSPRVPVGFLHVFWLKKHAFGKLAVGGNVCLFLAPSDELVT